MMSKMKIDADQILSNTANIMSSGSENPHPIVVVRESLGWSQAMLAARTGIPRSTLSAIETERAVPSVKVALNLAQALDQPVERLFRDRNSGSDWTWAWHPVARSVRYYAARIGDKRLLFPVESLAQGIHPHDGIWQEGEAVPTPVETLLSNRTLVVACCDPAAGLLMTEMARTAEIRLIVLERGGLEALRLLKQGLVHAAGLHFSTPEDPDRNEQIVRREMGTGFVLLRTAVWEQGLVFPSASGHCTVDEVLRASRNWALRESGSAARECLDELVSTSSSLSGRIVSSHAAVALSVQAGWADAGICVKLCAEKPGIDFRTIRQEAFDLCYRERDSRDPLIDSLIRLLRSDTHRRRIAELPGYHSEGVGERMAV